MTLPTDNRWRLPDGIEEALPERAWHLEHLRYRLLGLFARWGYDFVIPPLIEYLDSLLIGAGRDLDLDTFKLVDQISGRMMGVRADMTPQVARIDAHRLGGDQPVRLCYLGAVLHTRQAPFGGSRSPLQLGAELFGHNGMEADLEVIELLLAAIEVAGVDDTVTVDLGHVGIVSALADAAGFRADERDTLYEILQRKSIPDLEDYLFGIGMGSDERALWRAVADLNGHRAVLDEARASLAGGGEVVLAALDHLAALGDRLQQRHPELNLHFDLAELRGYRYHTGVVFALYTGREGVELARGGRYDGIGAAFGRDRPATGFSTDLRRLAEYAGALDRVVPGAIAAPADEDPALAARIRELRSGGERVIVMLPGQCGGPHEMGCDRRLVWADNDWQIEEI